MSAAMSRTLVFATAAVAPLWLSLMSCSDYLGTALEPDSSTEPSFVSEPMPAPALHSNAGGSAGSSHFVYVSLQQGSHPDGREALVRHVRSGVEAVRPIVDGALDPVALVGHVGDEVEVTVTMNDGSTASLRTRVPTKTRPHVVRTSPPRDKKDVPLNLVLSVVFSKPMSANSVTAIGLFQGGVAIPGSVVLNADGVQADFHPAEPLQANLTYVLSIPGTLTDAAGNLLESAVEVEFATVEGSSDGSASLIAFVAAGVAGAADIFVAGTDAPDVLRLTSHAADDTEAAWSPDRTRIAFRSERDGNGEIYVMRTDGTEPTRLTNHPARDAEPAWSPDGSTIAFVSDRDGNPEIYTMKSDGSALTRLTNTASTDRGPAWSPDGTRIAFSSDRDGNGEIYLMNVDGSDVQRLTDHASDDAEPAFSPDGSRLAFSRFIDRESTCTPVEQIDTGTDLEGYERMCRRDILIMSLPGGDIARLPFPTTHVQKLPSGWWRSVFVARRPAWSPDGTRIASSVFVCFSDLGGADCHSSTSIVISSLNSGTGIVELTGGMLESYAPRLQLAPAWRP